MRKLALVISVLAAFAFAAGCGNKEVKNESSIVSEQAESQSVEEAKSETTSDPEEGYEGENPEAVLADGVYQATFQTDSSMFHVNEALDGKGTLTVENGKMTIHISLVSKNIINLYPGVKEDAENSDDLIEPTEDEITYKDGYTETVYGFDVPVPVLDEEFDLALIGKKGKWYDHKVCVKDVVPIEE